MTYLVSIAIFALLVGAYYLLIGRRRTARETAALMTGTIAVLPMLNGGVLLIEEIARQQRGRSTAGVVVGKAAAPWMGEAGTNSARHRTWSGRGADAESRYRFELYGGIVRLLATGSPDAWIVEYRYSCGRSARCWRHEAVSHRLWTTLRVGETVAVRTIVGRETSGRLEANPPWGPALARLAIGGTLFTLATWASGALTRRRETLIAVPAVVTSVQPVEAAGAMHWRVGFAYLCAEGLTHERVDEVYVAGLQPGQECTAVYPRGRPHLGTLRLRVRDTAARA